METISDIIPSYTWSPANRSEQWTDGPAVHKFQSVNNDSGTDFSPPDQAVFFPCNNPENLINEATVRLVGRVINIGILPPIQIFGIVTNIINLIVFHQQGLKDQINLCLFTLALADLSSLLLMLVAKFYSLLGLFDEDLEDYWRRKFLQTVLGPMRAVMNISYLMTMIISIERCVCVVSLFSHKTLLKTKCTVVVIVLMAVYILGVYSLLNMKYQTFFVNDPVTNTSRWVSRLSKFYLSNHTVVNILYNYMLFLTIPCLTLIVVIITTSITVTKLRKRWAWKSQRSRSPFSLAERRETIVTKMLTMICVIYITTITPSVTNAFVRTVFSSYMPTGKYCNAFVTGQSCTHVCEAINASANFVVYYTMRSSFRDQVRQLFGLEPDPKLHASSPESPAPKVSSLFTVL